ncbi:MAG: PEGA domain-containing protein [Polyangia bacterium]|jgi:hypothetical protein|nr:PEGA domain-containing protein [Polyangia bacterium]
MGSRVLSGDVLARGLDSLFGRTPQEVSASRRQTLLASLKDAAQATYMGDWERATRLLSWVRRELADDLLGQARQRALFDALQQARILLAECHARNGRSRQAWLLMEEALRAQPDLSLSPTIYGPILQGLHYRVRSQLELQRTTLRVESTPKGAAVFLAGRYLGISPVLVSGLYQGTYELIVLLGDRASRVRRVQLANEPTSVEIDLSKEAALRTGREVGIYIPEGPKREVEELRWGGLIGRQLGHDKLILLGIVRRQGRRALVGRVLAGHPHRTRALAYVFMEPTSPSRGTLERLAEFLLHGGTPGPGVEIVAHAQPGSTKAPGKGKQQVKRSNLWTTGWSLVGLGLAAGAGGAAALVLDGRTGREATTTASQMVYRTGRLGYGLLGGGLGAALVGAALLVVDAARRRRRLGTGDLHRGGHDGRTALGIGSDGKSLLVTIGGSL